MLVFSWIGKVDPTEIRGVFPLNQAIFVKVIEYPVLFNIKDTKSAL